jgi:hypothetical protein
VGAGRNRQTRNGSDAVLTAVCRGFDDTVHDSGAAYTAPVTTVQEPVSDGSGMPVNVLPARVPKAWPGAWQGFLARRVAERPLDPKWLGTAVNPAAIPQAKTVAGAAASSDAHRSEQA